MKRSICAKRMFDNGKKTLHKNAKQIRANFKLPECTDRHTGIIRKGERHEDRHIAW